jgi:KDO2-lipid IV(A) lauroyltransferase
MGRGVKVIERGTAAREAAARLARGEWVVAMLDQAPERRRGVTEVCFLGELATVDLAPALLAMRARRPMVVAFPCRTATGHGVEVLGVLTPPRHPRSAWPREAMAQATRWLEVFVRRHPEQWLWMHRRWKPGRCVNVRQ